MGAEGLYRSRAPTSNETAYLDLMKVLLDKGADAARLRMRWRARDTSICRAWIKSARRRSGARHALGYKRDEAARQYGADRIYRDEAGGSSAQATAAKTVETSRSALPVSGQA